MYENVSHADFVSIVDRKEKNSVPALISDPKMCGGYRNGQDLCAYSPRLGSNTKGIAVCSVKSDSPHASELWTEQIVTDLRNFFCFVFVNPV